MIFNPFPHTTILQQTTLNILSKNSNIVVKGEIARFEQFPLLSLCFQKAVCCRDVRKRLYEGKSLQLEILLKKGEIGNVEIGSQKQLLVYPDKELQ